MDVGYRTGTAVPSSEVIGPATLTSNGTTFEVMSSKWIDGTNGVAKTGEVWTAGTLTGAADGATLTGVGVLRKLIISNGSGAAITVNVYDNTAASGTKLTPLLHVPTLSQLVLDLAVPYSLGVYVDFSTATSCDALGYSQAVV